MQVNPESEQLSSIPTHANIQTGPTGADTFRQVLGGTVSLAGQLAGSVSGASTMGLGPIAGNLASSLLTGTGSADSGTADPMQLLQLQEQLQQQEQVFNTMSNISKTEHETRMAAVRNMKE